MTPGMWLPQPHQVVLSAIEVLGEDGHGAVVKGTYGSYRMLICGTWL